MNPSSVLLAAIASGGLAGALIGFLVASQTGSESTASIPVEVNTTGDTDTQLAMLRQQLGDMESRLSSVELRSTVTTARAPQTAPVEGLDEIRELLAALQEPNAPAPPQLRSMVDRALNDREAAEEAEEQARREEQRLERIDRRVTDLASELGMDATQSKSMKDALYAYETGRDEMFRSFRNPGSINMDRDTIRSTMEEQRNSLNTQVQTFLTPVQYEGFLEEYSSRSWGGRDGGRGGGGGGRGGGF